LRIFACRLLGRSSADLERIRAATKRTLALKGPDPGDRPHAAVSGAPQRREGKNRVGLSRTRHSPTGLHTAEILPYWKSAQVCEEPNFTLTGWVNSL
jgi:hypothetical protein